MKNDNKKIQVFVAISLVFLLFTIPFTSALSLSSIGTSIKNAVTKVINAVKNTVTKVVNFFKGSSNTDTNTDTGSDTSKDKNTLGGSQNVDTYYPFGQGNAITSPDVVYSPPISSDVSSGDSLYHDVDLTGVELTCINCPVSNPQISGFDYNLKVSFSNKGNTIAKDVEMTIALEFPDGEKRSYSFTGGNALNIAPGNYKANFIIPSVGVTGQNQLKPYAIRTTSDLKYDIKTTITLSNDRGVDRAKIRYEYTPVRECKWTGTSSNPVYSCTDLETTKTTLFYCSDGTLIRKDTSQTPKEPTLTELKNSCSITDAKEENQIKQNLQINTVSAELWGAGGLTSVLR